MRCSPWFIALALLGPAEGALATAEHVYHERTTASVGGACGSFTDGTHPTPSADEIVRFVVRYQFYTNSAHVYYTTDGSQPGGGLGVPSGTTAALDASYSCTYQGSDPALTDVLTTGIPASAVGTIVRYIVSAHHTGGGPEVFGNTGASTCTNSGCATVFTYTIECMGDEHCGGATPACIVGSCHQCSATNAIACIAGETCDAENGVCVDCEANCESCTDASTCTQCTSGFVVEDGDCLREDTSVPEGGGCGSSGVGFAGAVSLLWLMPLMRSHGRRGRRRP